MKGSRDRRQYHKEEVEKRSAAGRGRFCCSRLSSFSPKDGYESEDWECYCCSSRACRRRRSWNHNSGSVHFDIHKSGRKQISTLEHTMVQHQLDQMIRDTTEQSYRCRMTEVTAAARRRGGRRTGCDAVAVTTTTTTTTTTAGKGTTMVVVEKCSEDPRQDFVDSVATMITANKLQNPNNLRALLDYYMSVNPQELHVIILDAFYQVCTDMFSSSKCYSYSADF